MSGRWFNCLRGRWWGAGWLAAAVLLGRLAWGQPAEPAQDVREPRTRELVVRPAPPPRPALRWQLVPSLMERKPGNAATFYYRAALQLNAIRGGAEGVWKDYNENEKQWLSNDRQTYPLQAVKSWLHERQLIFDDLRIAAYREHCDWDWRLKDVQGDQFIQFLLYEAQEMRGLARIVRLQAHAQRMEGQTEAAFQTLRLGYQMGLDIGRSETIVSSLIGIAILIKMNEELFELMQTGQDNYYWAIASFRPALTNLFERALRRERNLPYEFLPILKDASTARRSPEEWRRLMSESLAAAQQMSGNLRKDRSPTLIEEWAATGLAMLQYPQARQRLLDQGWDPQKLDAMPAVQVVAIDAAMILDETYDELLASFYLPFPHAFQRMQQIEQGLQTQMSRRLGESSNLLLVPVRSIIPACSALLSAQTRLQHQFAALQAIEALRMHAAQHGQWPERLEDVTVVPVPNDPINEAPFRYRREGDQAILEPAEGVKLPHSPVERYILRLKRD